MRDSTPPTAAEAAAMALAHRLSKTLRRNQASLPFRTPLPPIAVTDTSKYRCAPTSRPT